MILVNGKMFSVNCKPFLNPLIYLVDFLKCFIFKVTQLWHKLCIKTIYQMLKKILQSNWNNLQQEENKMYTQLPWTSIDEFEHRLFYESKMPRFLITQQEFFGKWSLPSFWGPGK